MGQVSAHAFEFDGSKTLFSSLFTLDALKPEDSASWVNVAMAGEWNGHPKGPFRFTAETFRSIVRNFEAIKNPAPFDYEHDSMRRDVLGPKPASGFIQQLELRSNDSELWALVEWTPRAARMIRDGEYRFCSPVVDFEHVDRETGEDIGPTLLNVALTNMPFLDGQHPIKQLTAVQAMAEESMTEEEKKAKEAEVAAEAKAAEDDSKTEDAAESDAKAMVESIAKSAGVSPQDLIAKFLGDDDVIALAKKKCGGDAMYMSVAAAAEHKFIQSELTAAKSQVIALTARVAEMENGGQDAAAKAEAEKAEKVKAHVAQLTAAGHIGDSDAEQEAAAFMFSHDFERASVVFAEKKVPIGVSQASAGASGKTEKKRAPATVVALSQLDAADRMAARILMAADQNLSEEKAVSKVVAQRDGKVN